tara:strand:+ start:3040 stop:4020 length:981 start_codon:yes stop_codon:yes gene_type:complete
MSHKKILITGGLGFLGFHCVEHWTSLGSEITVIDDLSTNAVSKNEEIYKDVNVIEKNILEISEDELGEFDLIIHLASPVGPVGVLKHSGTMGKTIIDTTNWAINMSSIKKCPLIYISTSEIYGHRNEKMYLSENDDKVLHGEFTVRNEYSMSKLLAEIIITNHSKIDSNFKFQIIRPFNVTGKFQLPDGGFVLPRFVNQALNNEDLTVYFDGSQLRAFTWVKDIVSGIFLTTTAEEEDWNEIWNVGNEKNEKSIRYLAEKVIELTNSSSKILSIDPVSLHGNLFAEAPEKIPDSSKLRNKLNWKPIKSADEVIKEVVDHFKEIKGI